MSNVLEKIRTELQRLLEKVKTLELSAYSSDVKELVRDYEIWYMQAYPLVEQLAPERRIDFATHRRDIMNYFERALSRDILSLFGDQKESAEDGYRTSLVFQAAILAGAEYRLDSVVTNIRTSLRAEIFDADMAGARELLKAQFLRPAGIVASVVLEKHLEAVANRRGIKKPSKKPTLGQWHETLEKANVFDAPMSLLIKRLVEIRNYCAHSKEREPKADEVQDLLDGVDKVIKEVF